MSRSFAGINTQQFIGTPFLKKGRIQNQVAQIVPLTLNWNTYWQAAGNPLNVGVNVNLRYGLGNVPILSTITSLYIDNTNSACPIYVTFTDTGETITAQPYSAGWYLALTNDFLFTVYAENLVPNLIPTTMIFLTDVFVIPNVEFEVSQTQQLLKASPVIQQGTVFFNQNYAVPSIGDQVFTATTTDVQDDQLFNVFFTGIQTSGFYYVKSISMGVVCVTGPTSAINPLLQIKNSGGSIIKWQFRGAFSFANSAFAIPYEMSGMDVKLDATQQWVWSIQGTHDANTFGAYSLNICFTYNPLNP